MEFHKLSSTETQPESTGFFARVKELFDGLGSATAMIVPIRFAALSLGGDGLNRLCLRHVTIVSHTVAAMRPQSSLAEKKGLRLDDEVRFIRSWLEKPLAIGAVTPSGRVLARTMARYVDTEIPGPVVELGPGTGPVTEALVARGVHPKPPGAGGIQSGLLPPAALALSGSDRGAGRRLCPEATARRMLEQPAAAVVSGLPLLTKPMRTRLRLINEAFGLMQRHAPFVQFTYSMAASPIPKGLPRVAAEASAAHLDEPAAGAGLGLSQGAGVVTQTRSRRFGRPRESGDL